MAAYAQMTTRICRVLMGLVVLWGLVGVSSVESFSIKGDTEDTRATLRGIDGVHVWTSIYLNGVEEADITKQKLQAEVELRLRQAGIRVLTQEEWLGMPGHPSLFIVVFVAVRLGRQDRLLMFNYSIWLAQDAFLATDGYKVNVDTWGKELSGSVWTLRPSEIRNDVRGVPVAHVQETSVRGSTVKTVEENERLRSRIPWKQTPYILNASCRI
jgi:hypothetical protein